MTTVPAATPALFAAPSALAAPVRLGLLSGEAALLRVGSNRVFVDRDCRRVFRVSLTALDPAGVQAHLERVMDLFDAGAPVLPPESTEVLVNPDGTVVTVWPYADPLPDPEAHLPVLLADLHAVGDPHAGWMVNHPGSTVAPRLAKARTEGVVPTALIDFLEAAHVRLGPPPSRAGSARVVVHGDPHAGNVASWDDRPVLIDLDDMEAGAPEIDLASVAVEANRFGHGGPWHHNLDALLAVYSRPVDRDYLAWAMRMRQVTMTSWAMSLWHARPEAAAEVEHRVATWDTHAAWHPL